jgi:hypothetical protein
MKKRDPGRRRLDASVLRRVRERLLAGQTLSPELLSAERKKSVRREAGDR